jgi:hypothetical protein
MSETETPVLNCLADILIRTVRLGTPVVVSVCWFAPGEGGGQLSQTRCLWGEGPEWACTGSRNCSAEAILSSWVIDIRYRVFRLIQGRMLLLASFCTFTVEYLNKSSVMV